MRIDIWSDVVCPWCYVGKRRLETALAGFEHAAEVELVWRSFQLDPAAPTDTTESVAEHLGRKYGGGPRAGQQMVDRMEAVAAEEGLVFRLGEAQRAGTLDAHRLLHLALDTGGPALQGRLKEELLAAYFLRAQNPADHATLTRVAVGVGLPSEAVARVLGSDEYADAVAADVEQAVSYGAGGVPFFVVEGRYGVSGAQPADVLGRVLEQAWSEAHRPVPVIAGGEVCGPEGCD